MDERTSHVALCYRITKRDSWKSFQYFIHFWARSSLRRSHQQIFPWPRRLGLSILILGHGHTSLYPQLYLLRKWKGPLYCRQPVCGPGTWRRNASGTGNHPHRNQVDQALVRPSYWSANVPMQSHAPSRPASEMPLPASHQCSLGGAWSGGHLPFWPIPCAHFGFWSWHAFQGQMWSQFILLFQFPSNLQNMRHEAYLCSLYLPAIISKLSNWWSSGWLSPPWFMTFDVLFRECLLCLKEYNCNLFLRHPSLLLCPVITPACLNP